MREARGTTYRPWNPAHYRHEAQSPAAQLPQDDLVFFLLDTVSHVDLSRFYAPYEEETRGAPPFDPKLMVWLLLYADCVGGLSSRQIAQACAHHLACIAIGGQERPDFRPIREFRQLPLAAFGDVCVEGLRIAGEAGLVQLGQVSTDGTQRPGHAARPKARSDG